MNSSFAIILDNKTRFDCVVKNAKEYFKADIKRVSKYNVILTQRNDQFIIDLTPNMAKCFIFSNEVKSVTDSMRDFFGGYNLGEQISIYRYDSN